MLHSLRLRLRALFRQSTVEAEMHDELLFHIEEQTQLYMRNGMTRAEANRLARARFGSVHATKESYPLYRRGVGVDALRGDIRYAIRTLWRDRGLAVAGILTLALGVGATTAVFSAVNAVMLRELPFRDSNRLVAIWEQNPDRNWYKNVVAPANYVDWRARVKAFEGVAAYTDYLSQVTMLGRGEPRFVPALNTSGNFLAVLGVKPQLGRGFDDADDWDGGRRPVIISHRLWKTAFG